MYERNGATVRSASSRRPRIEPSGAVAVTSDGVLDPLYPQEYEYVCKRCERAVERPDERAVQRLHLFATLAEGDRLRNADRYLPLCPACQRRAEPLLDGLTRTEVGVSGDRTDVPSACGRCDADGQPDDTLIWSSGGATPPRRWSARLCGDCSSRFRASLDELVAEPTPYDGEWYRPPAFLRAAAAIDTHGRADADSVREVFRTLGEGDLVRVVASRRGWRGRGSYLAISAWVERVLAPLREGPPERVELRTAEHHCSYPPDRARDRWTLRTGPGDRPTVEFAGSRIEVDVLSVVHRSSR